MRKTWKIRYKILTSNLAMVKIFVKDGILISIEESNLTNADFLLLLRNWSLQWILTSTIIHNLLLSYSSEIYSF